MVPETTVVLQRYAATDSSSKNTLDQDEFLVGRIVKLKTQVKPQKAANDEAKANLVVHDVIRGHKDIGDVPLELLANVKKVLEKRMAKLLTQSTTTSSCVSYEFYYFILTIANCWYLLTCHLFN